MQPFLLCCWQQIKSAHRFFFQVKESVYAMLFFGYFEFKKAALLLFVLHSVGYANKNPIVKLTLTHHFVPTCQLLDH